MSNERKVDANILTKQKNSSLGFHTITRWCTPVHSTTESVNGVTVTSQSYPNLSDPFMIHYLITHSVVVIAAKLQAELRRMQRRKEIKAQHRSRREQGWLLLVAFMSPMGSHCTMAL